VTSKDHGFIRRRTAFACAWACVSGLEIVLSDGRTHETPQVGGRLREGLQYVKHHEDFGLAFELKHSTAGTLLAFSVDWRRTSEPPNEFIRRTTGALTRMGLVVAYDPSLPFLDVFGATPDKGRAVQELKGLLNVSGSVLFLGDSVADNRAFEMADVGICIAHGQEQEDLKCRFSLRHDELGGFLTSLADGALSLDLRLLKRR